MDAPFEIDLQTGTLKIPQIPLTLVPKQPLAAFLATKTRVTGFKEAASNDGWQRYRLSQPLADGQTLGLSLFFFNGILLKIRFDYRSQHESDWSNWSKQRELARSETFREEIARQLGRRGRFPWGLADAGYDDKSGSAVLFINYGDLDRRPK